MDTTNLNNDIDPNQLIPTDEIIKLAKESGVKFGFGDTRNRIRYLVKNGLLPHQVRKVLEGKIVPHLPYLALAKLVEIQELQNKFKYTIPQLISHFNDAAVKTERSKYDVENVKVVDAGPDADVEEGEESNAPIVPAVAAGAVTGGAAIASASTPPTVESNEPLIQEVQPTKTHFGNVVANNKASAEEALNATKLNIKAADREVGKETDVIKKSKNHVKRYVIIAAIILVALLGVIAPGLIGGDGISLSWLTGPLNDRLGFFRDEVKEEIPTEVDRNSLSQSNVPEGATGTIEVFGVNIPAYFSSDVTFGGTVNIDNQNINLGTGEILASNVIYSIVAGDGVQVSAGQNPVITNLGVLSIGGATGDVELEPGEGIEIDGTEITNIGVLSLGGETGELELEAGADIDINGLQIALQPVIDTVTQINLPADSSTALRFGNIGVGEPGSSNTDSGAFLIGVFDEFTSSDSTNVQAVLNDFDTTISGTTHNPTTIVTNGYDYLTFNEPLQIITLNAIDLAADVTGLLPTANGGLGANVTAAGAGEILYSTGTTTYDSIVAGSVNQILTSGGAGAPSWNNITALISAGDDIDITGTTSAVVALEDDIEVSSVSASTENGISIFDNGGNLGVFVEDGGNVGIGTTNPASLLSVGNNSQFQINSSGNIVRIGGVNHTIANVSGNLSFASVADMLFDDSTLSSAVQLADNDATLPNGNIGIVDAINDAYDAATGGGSGGLWTLAGNVIYPTVTTNDFAIGGTTLSNSMFSIDESAGIFEFGSDNSANPALRFEATDSDQGEFGFNTNDSFYFTGANVGIGTSAPAERLTITSNNYLGSTNAAINGTVKIIGLDTNDRVSIAPAGGESYFGGNLGVGTTDPSERLHVTGNALLSGTDVGVYFRTAAPAFMSEIRQQSEGTLLIAGGGTARNVNVYRGSLFVEQGNLGVGTTGPESKLTVAGGASIGSGLTGIGISAPTQGLLVQGFTGIGSTNPGSLFAVGNNSQFQINSTGNIVRVNGIATSFPSSQGAAGSLLTNDGSGNLSWSGSEGSIGFWQRNDGVLSPAIITDNIGIGTTGAESRLVVSGNASIGSGYTGIGISAPTDGLLVQGRVGIGNTNPLFALDVMGTSWLRGSTAATGGGLYVGSSGSATRVGIGTTAPITVMNVAGNSYFTIASEVSSAFRGVQIVPAALGSDQVIRAWSTSSNFKIAASSTASGHDQAFLNLNPTGYISFNTSAGAAGTEKMRLDSNGNLGIGTTAPESRFTLAGEGSIGRGYTGIGISAPLNGLLVQGNVGIGNTNPSQKLSIAGTLGILEGGASPQHYTVFQGGDQSGNITYTLPTTDGEGDYVLATDGNGVLSWQSAAGVGAGNGDITAVNAGSGLIGGGTVGDVTLNIGAGDGITVSADEIAINLATTGGVGSTASFSGLEVGSDGLGLLSGCGDDGVLMWNDSASLWECAALSEVSGITGSGTDNYIPRWNGSTALNDSVIYQTDAGNVGIGTTGPESKLAVKGNATIGTGYTGIGISAPQNGLLVEGRVGIGSTGPVTALDVLAAHVSGIGVASFKGTGSFGYISTDTVSGSDALSGIVFKIAGTKIGEVSSLSVDNSMNIYNNIFSASPMMTFTSNGRVGVGTTTPLASLDVTGTAWLRGSGFNGLFVNSSGRVGIGTTGPQSLLTVAGGASIGSGYTGIGISAPTMGLLVQGNVGIGNTNPFYKLDVNGDIRVASGSDFYKGTIGLGHTTSATASGAFVIGAFDEFGNSDSNNVQDVLDDLDSAITSATHDPVTFVTNGFDYLTLSDQEITLSAIDLDTDVANTLPTANGGLNADVTPAGAGEILYSTSATAYDSLPAGNSGQLLVSGGAGAPSWANITSQISAGDDIDVTGTTTATVALEDAIDVSVIAASTGLGLKLTDDGGNLGVFVEDGGQVGIGTSSPGFELDVTGTFRTTGNLTFGDAGADTVTANAAAWTFANDTNFALSGGINGLSFDTLTFSVDATNDRIGIGTTAPESKLSVAGGATIGAGLTGIGISAPLNGLLVQGNVGIGSTNPLYALDVAGFGRIRNFVTNSLELSGRITSLLTAQTGFDGYSLFRGGIGTGGNGKDSVVEAQRLTAAGNLINIGSYQGGQMNLTSGGTFGAKTDYALGGNIFGFETMATGDVNGDGYNDIIVPLPEDALLQVFFNDGDGTFTSNGTYATGANPKGAGVGDFNGDGYLDLVSANVNPNSISVFINDGDGTFAAKVDYTTDTNPYRAVTGDVNRDGAIDIVSANFNGDSVTVFLNVGNGTFAAGVDYTTGDAPQGVAMGDLNGDSIPDLAVTNVSDDDLSVFINNGNGTFAAKVDYATGTFPESLVIADVNGDGKADLATANTNSTNMSVFINDGDGTFAAKVDYTTGTSPNHVMAGDLNGDGKHDLAVVNIGTDNISVFINNGDGTFATKVDYSTGDEPYSGLLADFNNDGKADLVSMNDAGQSISVLMNQPSTMLFAQASTGRVGIGTTAPGALFAAGNNNQFLINSTGNITRLNGVTTSFPSSQGAAGSVLTNNGSGTLTWNAPGGTGAIGYWQRVATTVSPTTISDNVGIGATNVESKLVVAGNASIGSGYTGIGISAPLNGLLVEGNVGIGTTDPSFKLDVNGTFRTTGNLTFGDASGDTVTSNAATWTFANDTDVVLSGGVAGLNFDTNTLSIDSTNDRVGIGTTAPESKLVVAGGAMIGSGLTGIGISAPTMGLLVQGNTGIGSTSPGALFAVGSSNQFLINSTGNITRLNGVTTSFPSAQGAANSILRNDGSGNLSWVDPSGANGAIGYWQKVATTVSPTTLTDNVGIGATNVESRLVVAGNVSIGSGYTGIGISAPVNGLLVQGNVGIGTTNPASSLEVNLNQDADTAITVRNINAGTSARAMLALFSDSANESGIITVTSGAYDVVPDWADSMTLQARSDLDGGLVMYSPDKIRMQNVAGTDALTVIGGNVGIGTTSPATGTSLHINRAAAHNVLRLTTGSSTYAPGIQFGDGGEGSADFNIGQDDNFFSLSAGGSFGAIGLGINGSGNVGIGTTAPGSILDVQAATGELRVTSTTGTNAAYTRYTNTGGNMFVGRNRSTTGGLATGALGNAGIISVESAHALQFGTNSNIEMTILSGGNVGIGITAPTSGLDVVGQIRSRNGSHHFILNDTATGVDEWSLTTISDADFGIYENGTTRRFSVMEGGDVGIGTHTPVTRLDIDTESNVDGLRLRGTAETAEIADMYVSSTGALVLDTTAGSDTAGLIDLRPEDDSFGLILRESDGTGTATFANFYAVDSADDYMSINLNAATTTSALNITANNRVGIGATPGVYKLDILSSDTTGGLQVIADSITTGTGTNMSFDGLTTGTGLALASTSTVLSTGGLVDLDWSPTGSTEIFATGDLFSINVGQFGNAGNVFALYDNASTLFKVSQAQIESAVPHLFSAAGDVSIANDLVFTNQTSGNINSYGPLTITSGESFENQNLSLQTYGTGNLALNLGTSGNVIHTATDASYLFNTRTATDTDFWMGVIDDGAGDDDDIFAIGDGSVAGTNPFLSVTTSGTVGIGTTSPTTLLNVVTSSAANNAIALVAGATRAVRLGATATGGVIEGVDNTGVTTYQPLFIGGSDLRFTLSGVESMKLTSAGDLGIGTTAPASILEIRDSQATFRISDNRSTTHAINSTLGSIEFYTADPDAARVAASIRQLNDVASASLPRGALQFNVSSTGAEAEAMRISSGSLVGIGTTGPQAKLDILNTAATPALNITSHSVTTGNVIGIGSTGLTSGSALSITGSTISGTTGNLINITSDIGPAGNMMVLTPDFSGTVGTRKGLYINGTDATAVANADYGIDISLQGTGNAAKDLLGLSSVVSSTSTTADDLTGGFFSAGSSGAISAGSRFIAGLSSTVASTGANTGGTANIYGADLTASSSNATTGSTSSVYGLNVEATGTLTTAGTLNLYGIYVEDGASNTTGTTTEYGLFIEQVIGADTAYSLRSEGAVSFGTQRTLANDATPDVSGGSHFITGGTTTITDFDAGAGNLVSGHIIYIESAHAVTIDVTASGINGGSTDIVMAAGDMITMIYDGTDWNVISFMDDTDNLNDLAEYFVSSEDLEPGDVVSIDPNNDEKIIKTTGEYQSNVIGIISTAPGLILGGPATEETFLVGLAGRVPVKVSTENGPIQRGDYLTSSSVPGVAMKATENGATIGKALAPYDGEGVGQVMAFIDVSWYAPGLATIEDLGLETNQHLTFDIDDDSDTYMKHDADLDRLSVMVDGAETFRFSPSGNSSNGSISTSLSDLAESYPTMDISLEPGDVVVLDTPVEDEETGEISKYMVARSGGENKDKVLGVVTSKPGLLMGAGEFRAEQCKLVDEDEDQARENLVTKEIRILAETTVDAEIAEDSTKEDDRADLIEDLIADLTAEYEAGEEVLDEGVLSAIEDSIAVCKSTKQVDVALAGRIPVKYDNSNGEIEAGDLLAVSEVQPGRVVKATDEGWVVGRALEASSDDEGMLMMFVNLSWFSGDSEALAFDTEEPTDIDGLDEILEIQETDEGGKRAVFFSDMNVTGNVTADSFSTLGEITAGFLKIDGSDDSISVIGGGDLKLQNGVNPGNIEAFNGELLLTAEGGIIAKGDIEAESVAARNFTVLGAQDPEQSASVGEGIITAGTTEIVIMNTNVRPTSKVFVTATTETGTNNLIVSNKIDGAFVVKIKQAIATDIKFDYWIVGVKEVAAQ